MKKTIAVMLAAILLAACLTGCGNAQKPDNGRLQIVTTIFPEYDWVRNILGENPAEAEVTMLLDTGVDLHSFQPTAEDILQISTCDLFLYVGGESDEWVDDALRSAANKDMVVINLLDVLGDAVKEEEMVEGMQEEDHEHAHDEDGEHEEDHDHEHAAGEVESDEHVWLSLRNAAVLVKHISDVLQAIDPDNAKVYRGNSAAYVDQLNALDERYQAAVSEAPVSTLLFGDRFPFRYLVDDYSLDYYAAFAGCSAESEASFETIRFLSGKVDELKLHAILTIEGNDHRIAETIRDNTASKDQQILPLDSLQSVTAKDAANGVTYLSVMEKNLEVIKEALR